MAYGRNALFIIRVNNPQKQLKKGLHSYRPKPDK